MGKARRLYFPSNLLLPFFGLSALYTYYHLTQPAGLASLNRSTGSMFVYHGHSAGTTVEGGFNTQRSRTSLPLYICYKSMVHTVQCTLYNRLGQFVSKV